MVHPKLLRNRQLHGDWWNLIASFADFLAENKKRRQSGQAMDQYHFEWSQALKYVNIHN
jgi:hypothetical protein